MIGARLTASVILIMGFANLIADGFSMASSNYLGTKTEHEDLERLRAIEHHHIEHYPDGEREEVRQIFMEKGFEGDDLERVVELITSDHGRWVATMLTEEYGLPREVRPPLIAATVTFVAFVVCGLVPLMPFLINGQHSFSISAVMTGAVFFAIGSAKSRWSTVAWWKSGFWTLVVGSVAAALAYCVGLLLKGLA